MADERTELRNALRDIGRAFDSYPTVQREWAIMANMAKLSDELEAEYAQTRTALEAERIELKKISEQIDVGKATLEQLRSERTAIKQDIDRLAADRDALERDIARVRKALGEAA